MSYVVTKVSELDNAPANLDPTDIVMVAVVDGTSPTGYKTVKMTGQQIIDGVGGTPQTKITASSQYKELGLSKSVPNGTALNLITLIAESDKVAEGTTDYFDMDLRASITLDPLGLSGTANVNVDGTDYLMTFNTDRLTTLQDWVTAHEATMNGLGIEVQAIFTGTYIGGNDGILVFTASAPDIALLSGITITNLTGDLDGDMYNKYTATPNVSSIDHFRVPYVGEPHDGQRLHHSIRVSFYVTTGTLQTYALTLKRFYSDVVIGSPIKVFRDFDEGGDQHIFQTYTNSAVDPFVTDGFYVDFDNDSGLSATIDTELGFLIQTVLQTPTIYP